MYIPGLTEALIIKGGAWLGTHVVAHLGTTAIAHAAASYVLTHGVLATVAAVAPIAIGSSFMVGGVLWAGQKIRLVNGILQDISAENIPAAALKIAQVASLLHSSCDDAAEAISDLLTEYYSDEGGIHQVCSAVKEIARNNA